MPYKFVGVLNCYARITMNSVSATISKDTNVFNRLDTINSDNSTVVDGRVICKFVGGVVGSAVFDQKDNPQAYDMYVITPTYELIFGGDASWTKLNDRQSVIEASATGSAPYEAERQVKAERNVGLVANAATNLIQVKTIPSYESLQPINVFNEFMKEEADELKVPAGLDYTFDHDELGPFLRRMIEQEPMAGPGTETAFKVMQNSFEVEVGDVSYDASKSEAKQNVRFKYLDSAEKRCTLIVVSDTVTGQHKLLTYVPEDVQGAELVSGLNTLYADINEHTAKLTMLAENCDVTDADIAAAREINVPEYGTDAQSLKAKAAHAKFMTFINTVEANRKASCDLEGLTQRATDAGLSVDDYKQRERDKAIADAKNARNPNSSVWNNVWEASKNVGGKISDYLAKWSPTDYLKAYAGYTVISSAKKSNIPFWIIGVGAVALFAVISK